MLGGAQRKVPKLVLSIKGMVYKERLKTFTLSSSVYRKLTADLSDTFILKSIMYVVNSDALCGKYLILQIRKQYFSLGVEDYRDGIRDDTNTLM